MHHACVVSLGCCLVAKASQSALSKTTGLANDAMLRTMADNQGGMIRWHPRSKAFTSLQSQERRG